MHLTTYLNSIFLLRFLLLIERKNRSNNIIASTSKAMMTPILTVTPIMVELFGALTLPTERKDMYCKKSVIALPSYVGMAIK